MTALRKKTLASDVWVGRPPKYPWRDTPVGGSFTVKKGDLPPESGRAGLRSVAHSAKESGWGTFVVEPDKYGGAIVTRIA